MKDSYDKIFEATKDVKGVMDGIESKVFGIGVEAFTAGSAEFTLSYAAANKDKCLPLMDNGHYHPTEVVSDKIPALLCFFPELALHVTRPVRWDSDHVVVFDDETKELCKEIVRCGLASAEDVLQEYPYVTARDRQLLQRVKGIRQMEMLERLSALYPVVFQNGEATIWKVAEK